MNAGHTRKQKRFISAIVLVVVVALVVPRAYRAWRETGTEPDFELVASRFTAALAQDSFYEKEADQLAALQRQKEITQELNEATSSIERESRLRLLYQLTLNAIQAEARQGNREAAQKFRHAAEAYVAQARLELKGLVNGSFDTQRFERNIRFLGVFAWILERRSTRTGCLAELRFCADHEGDYGPLARYLLTKTPRTDRFADGYDAMNQNDHVVAAKAFSDHLSRFPMDTEALYARGFCNLQMQLPEQALRDFEECLRVNPRDAIVLEAKGHALYRIGRTLEAITAWAAAEKLSDRRAPTLREWMRIANAQNK